MQHNVIKTIIQINQRWWRKWLTLAKGGPGTFHREGTWTRPLRVNYPRTWHMPVVLHFARQNYQKACREYWCLHSPPELIYLAWDGPLSLSIFKIFETITGDSDVQLWLRVIELCRSLKNDFSLKFYSRNSFLFLFWLLKKWKKWLHVFFNFVSSSDF